MNQLSLVGRLKKILKKRWEAEDYPGAKPRFQIALFAKDLGVFAFLPLLAVFLFKSCEMALSHPRKLNFSKVSNLAFQQKEGPHSQVIEFIHTGGNSLGSSKRAPGTLVKVRLLNVVETYSNAPVHAQIIDAGLGRSLLGSTIIGDATSDSNYNRIEMTFRFVRNPKNPSVAVPINARALSMDGTLGVAGRKKEGFFARAALNSSGGIAQDSQGSQDGKNLNQIIAKALTAGLIQEFGSDSEVERNRSQVLTLQPNSEFYVELTDYFPGSK